ncbi:MAG: plasmid pRiA4b ORF-3 family protein, partial [Oscillochloris sp.]|nr:plasmid pRiA4b ORF-3 family protein [Oscillochloris sp.]
MREDEPLESWLFRVENNKQYPPTPRDLELNRTALSQFNDALAAQPEGRLNYSGLPIHTLGRYSSATLIGDQIDHAQQLFLQVWRRGGTRANYAMDVLLDSIALAMDVGSVPFWKQLLDLSRPRDQSTTRRRTYALAALALLAIVVGDEQAHQSLAEALTHPHEQVRALAAPYIAETYRRSVHPLPPAIQAALTDIARNDRAFVARFQARKALRQLGAPVPIDSPNLIYLLKVQLRSDQATRTIAIPADHTLADLHYAIQHAFDWDADHLYSFYLTNNRAEKHYAIHCPELDENWDFTVWSITGVDMRAVPTSDESNTPVTDLDLALEDEGLDEGGEIYTTNTRIGALGLVNKHSFMYFFDYG